MSKLCRLMCACSLFLMAIFDGNAVRAECKALFYSVNDYGKEGPSQDAQDLLDKYIANWAKNKGVKEYKTSKKEIECELFLDFIVFDEYTCKATANVCW